MVVGALVVGCGGGRKPVTPAPESPEPATSGGAPKPPTDEPPPADEPPRIQHKPESFVPAWTVVGVGQTISFGVATIDEDLDETAVSVTSMPASARFDAITQTITWTPDANDLKLGRGSFVLTIEQSDAPGAAWARSEQVTFDITVDKHKQPAPTAPAASAIAETVLTIRDKARLANVNLEWPFDKMLVQAADLYRATLPPEIQARLGANAREDLYLGFLRALAAAHANPRLDPDSKDFDRDAFGTAEDWKIVAVRPRIDRAWCELRIIYQATAAPEPVFALVRLRPTWDSAALPAEARATNNAVCLGLVAKHLLDKNLGANARFAKDAKAEGKAVAALVRAIATYAPPAPKRGQPAPPPWQRAGFVGLWTEARMGGGSIRAADGGYRSGDGWAWSVMKPLATKDASAQAYVDVALPGVWADAAASTDGTSWIAACPPSPGLHCNKTTGLVDLPAGTAGSVTTATLDATNRFVELKRGDLVARLALDDARRDHGEDSAMTCAQCHTRHFGVRDYTDAATVDPSAGAPRTANAAIATVAFQMVPSPTAPAWPAYLIEAMKDEECRAKTNLEQALGKTSALTCPLAPAP